MKDPTLAIWRPVRPRWTRAPEQLRWVEAWESSGQTQVDFARDHNLSVATLRNWIRRHRGAPLPRGNGVELQEVDLGGVIARELAAGSTRWEAEIRLPSGASLAVGQGTSARRVRELLEALRC